MTAKKDNRRTHKCLKCGGTWQSLIDFPQRCAKCGVRTWTERQPRKIDEIKGLLAIAERLPFGEGCWLFYSKGNASGGFAKLGEFVGVSRRADKMPKKVKISLSHEASWD